MEVQDIKDLYKYMDGKEFIITHERQMNSRMPRVPFGRPVVCRIEDIREDCESFKGVQFDYDVREHCAYEYTLPQVKDFNNGRKGSLQFDIVSEHKNYISITRFWEV